MNNSKSEKIYRKAYSNYVTNVFSGSHDIKNLENEFERSFKFWNSYLFEIVNKYKKSSKVLDLGCGLGHTLYYFKKAGYKNYLGIDLSQENLEIANSYGFNTLKADAFKYLKSHPNSFDIITIFDVIEHFSKDEGIELLKLIKKSLKKNGVVIIETINTNNPVMNSKFYDDLTHETKYTSKSISTLLKLSGLGNYRVFTVNSFYLWDSSWRVRIIRKFIYLPISRIVELFYIFMAAGQGILLKECKPVLMGIGYK